MRHSIVIDYLCICYLKSVEQHFSNIADVNTTKLQVIHCMRMIWLSQGITKPADHRQKLLINGYPTTTLFSLLLSPNDSLSLCIYIYIYIYVWKLNQTVLELDFRAVKFCSSLDGIWTHTIDTLQYHSLSLTFSALDHSTTSTPLKGASIIVVLPFLVRQI